MKCYLLSHVPLFVTPGTVVCQAFLSIEFSRQEYICVYVYIYIYIYIDREAWRAAVHRVAKTRTQLSD